MRPIEAKAISAIRVLSADTVQKANSGHPGMPIGAAPTAYAIWSDMRHDPKDPACLGETGSFFLPDMLQACSIPCCIFMVTA